MRHYALAILITLLSQNNYARVCTEKDFIENKMHLCSTSSSPVSASENFTRENLYDQYEEDADKKSEYDNVWPTSADLCNINQLTGPTFKSYDPFSNYDYYRFITTYKVIKSKSRAPFPIFREECHDDSWRFGSFNKKITTKVNVTTSLNIKVIGLSVEAGVEYSIEFDRGVRATYGVVADHVPYIYSEIWEGVTQIQTFNVKTGAVRTLNLKYPFRAENINPIFVVERKVLQVFNKCPLNY